VKTAARPLRLGTRGSALALAQSGMIAEALRAHGAPVELIVIRTAGDGQAPDTAWGEGAFVTALEAALLHGQIDVAVHSAKDVPTTEDPRLRIAAYPAREDPRDALVALAPGATLDTLPAGSRIGSDSPRRVAFLLARRPDLRPHPLHGNVDTRLRKLEGGETDALILAVAGLSRLGLADRISEALPPEVVPPAPGQGALAVQCRADDAELLDLLGRIDDPETRAAVETERAFLSASGGGCRAPIGALGRVVDGRIELLAAAADPAGVEGGDAPDSRAADAPGTNFTGRDASSRTQRVAWARLAGPVSARYELAGAAALRLRSAIGRPAPVIVTREIGRAGELLAALRARGCAAVHVPAIAVEPVSPAHDLDAATVRLDGYAWVVVTSANGVSALAAATARTGADLASARIASVGAATGRALAQAGARAAFQPAIATAGHLADALPLEDAASVLVVRGDRSDGAATARLRERGAVVDDVIAYRTIEGPVTAEGDARAAVAASPAGVVFTSGSTVRGLLALLPDDGRAAARTLPAWCIGPATAAVARDCGFGTVLEAPAGDLPALADLVAASVPSSLTPPEPHP
jgi:hydroxymethylbilane synthase